MPISFFKTHAVKTTEFDAEVVFESSGTTQNNTSHHYVKKWALYEKCFLEGFRHFYGDVDQYCILGLLPGYLERQGSSLVAMADSLIKRSMNTHSGFFLEDHEKLFKILAHNEFSGQKTLLIGVTFALLDFSEKYQMHLKNTIIMETGGMKGRRKEMIREEVHQLLCDRLGVTSVHSEYGMTELLSQAYSYGNGIFKTPSWMKVLLRDPYDPLQPAKPSETSGVSSGMINVIDLANLYSCSFIATEDLGKLYRNGNFEVKGRSDTSLVRGCNLLVT